MRNAIFLSLSAICGIVILVPAGSARAQDSQYLVNPGDTLSISVWQEPDLQGDVVVRPDGYFSFPLAGDVQAAKQTVKEIENSLKGKLREYIPEVVATVSVSQLSGYKIYVIGQVQNPGEFLINTNVDVMRALAMAQGTTEFADLNDIRILRRVGGEQQTFKFDYKSVSRGRSLEQNVILQAGDVVIVP